MSDFKIAINIADGHLKWGDPPENWDELQEYLETLMDDDAGIFEEIMCEYAMLAPNIYKRIKTEIENERGDLF